MSKVKRRIIKDDPSDSDLFCGRGHERTAQSLLKAILDLDESDSAIGLHGSWGSGKSSVVKMADKRLAQEKEKIGKSYHFFTYDIWKSQGTSFRRSYLDHLITWAKCEFPGKKTKLKKIEDEIHGTTKEIRTESYPILDWYGILVLIFLPFLPLYYFWTKNVFDDLTDADPPWAFLKTMPFVALSAFALLPLAIAYFRHRSSSPTKKQSTFRRQLSRVLFISSRQLQDLEITRRVRERDPNDYEFHKFLREILGVVQTNENRIVLVLDNIDRLPQNEIGTSWAQVRSIFAPSQDNAECDRRFDISAIVPFDRRLIEASVNEVNENVTAQKEKVSSVFSRDLFAKTFDEVISVAPPVLSNAREFFSETLGQALEERIEPVDKFRTYLIFCESLDKGGGTTTPRQIISFVNSLCRVYELHGGRFKLPTVAAYLAHEAELAECPAILKREDGLDPTVVSLAADPRLFRNLAAMVFNVDEKLAFQILLDDDIGMAALAENPESLMNLSEAPGFDLRVDDVVRASIDEWTSTGMLARAIGNFSALFSTYRSSAKSPVADSLIAAFEKVESLSIKDDEFVPYMSLFEIAGEHQRVPVISHFVNVAIEDLNRQDSLRALDGKRFSSFLQTTSAMLARVAAVSDLRSALGQNMPPSSAEFLYGLGSSIDETGFGLEDFRAVELSMSDDSMYFEKQFSEFPQAGILALAQFQSCGLLSDDRQVSIANAALAAMREEKARRTNSGDLLEIVLMSRRYIAGERWREVELQLALRNGNFFRNLGEGETSQSQIAHATLLYLAQDKLGETLAAPTRVDSNSTQITDTSVAFDYFNTVLEGGAELESTQVHRLAKTIIDGCHAGAWIRHHMSQREHLASGQVVRAMFTRAEPPYLPFELFLSQFSLVNDIFESREVEDILSRYSNHVTGEEIGNLSLSEIPSGILSATSSLDGGLWKALHEHVGRLRSSVEVNK